MLIFVSFYRQGQASGLVPLQQQQQQQPQSNPAAGASLSSNAAAPTAGRDLQTVDNSAMQQHPQPQQRSTVYQQAGYTGQGPDRQMQAVCFYLDQLVASLCTVSFSLMHVNIRGSFKSNRDF